MATVVLGNRLISSDIHEQLRGRMDVGIKTFRKLNDDWLILSGGETNSAVPKAECDVMFNYAVNSGVNPNQIKRDSLALDTIGNGYFVRNIINNLCDVGVVNIVSSCYHMERAEYIFRQCFGPEYKIRSDNCHKFYNQTKKDGEEQKLQQAQNFFDSIQPGDIDAIREQLLSSHDLYNKSNI